MNASSHVAPLIASNELDTRLEEVVVVDVRWYLDGRSGRDAFRAGHLPGARFCDLDAALSASGPATAGRHPLPSPERFAKALGTLGVEESAYVVAYDDTGGLSAGRLVWMLRAIGQPASLLDGGLGAWEGDLESGDEHDLAPVPRVPRPWPARLLQRLEDLDALGPDDVVLDARGPERYRGDIEPIDRRAGHIPGAVNLPWSAMLGEDGRFLPRTRLRECFASVGVQDGAELVASCGSGVSACALLIGAEVAELGVGRLFVPSFSGWSASPTRPVATGGDPGSREG